MYPTRERTLWRAWFGRVDVDILPSQSLPMLACSTACSRWLHRPGHPPPLRIRYGRFSIPIFAPNGTVEFVAASALLAVSIQNAVESLAPPLSEPSFLRVARGSNFAYTFARLGLFSMPPAKACPM